MSKADLSKQPAQVAAMFDEVSTHYDRTNTVLSMGNATLWRVATTRAVGPRAGETILDVAAGTGTSSASLARNGATVVAADFSAGMIEVGRRRQSDNPFVSFVQADAMALPFDDETFDAVTISFGLRNIVDPRQALAEFHRVLKPGGRLVICEFSRPPLAPIRAGYGAYLRYGMPLLAKAVSSDPAAYEYLMESIQAWPSQPALAGWMRETGFERVAWRNLTAGIVALHRGWKAAKPVEAKSSATKSSVSESSASEPSASKPAAASSADAKPAVTKSSASQPSTAKSSAPKQSTTKSSAPKPSAAQSADAKPSAAKSSVAEPSTAKPSAPKPSTAKPSATKPSATKSSASKPSTATSAEPKPSAPKPSAPKPSAAASSASKPAASKPAASKSPKPAAPKSTASTRKAGATTAAAAPASTSTESAASASGSPSSGAGGAGGETSAVPSEGE